ncbi:hypothetical protein PanWU01x14_164210 [Parasponia andersonii]|uniref:Uncharacterized protein n=1 Tax=Parasponia andersonii TaxID=3476 RepID=A0A2P5CCF6_PARAD|nr:hypothetical protein PanWU01x14_164210 [Parasponia andersonii]
MTKLVFQSSKSSPHLSNFAFCFSIQNPIPISLTHNCNGARHRVRLSLTLTAPAPANNSTSCPMDLNFLTRSNRLELDSLPEFQTSFSISGDGEAQ